MDMRTEGNTGKGARGRKNSDGVTEVPKEIPETKYKDLEHVCRKAEEAGQVFNDACTAVGEKYNVKASVVKKVVKARLSDSFDDKKREVEQLAFAFGIIDSVSAPPAEDGDDDEATE
jgi:hypothetical protein